MLNAGQNSAAGRYTYGFLKTVFYSSLSAQMRAIADDPEKKLGSELVRYIVEVKDKALRRFYLRFGLYGFTLTFLITICQSCNASYLSDALLSIPPLAQGLFKLFMITVWLCMFSSFIFLFVAGVLFITPPNRTSSAYKLNHYIIFRFVNYKGIERLRREKDFSYTGNKQTSTKN